MQAVILAGGLGTRLGDITKSVPKPMVVVAGKPYLEHQLAMLGGQGFCDVLLLTGYLGEQIEDYFGDGSSRGFSIRYSRETTPQGTGGALRDAAALLATQFLLVYGDSFLPIDYTAVADRLIESTDAIGVVVVYDNAEATTVANNIALDAKGHVARYAKDAPPAANLRYVDAGVLAFRRRVLDYLPAGRSVSLEQEVYPQLIAEHRLLGYPTTQRFYDIGTPDRLASIERLLAK